MFATMKTFFALATLVIAATARPTTCDGEHSDTTTTVTVTVTAPAGSYTHGSHHNGGGHGTDSVYAPPATVTVTTTPTAASHAPHVTSDPTAVSPASPGATGSSGSGWGSGSGSSGSESGKSSTCSTGPVHCCNTVQPANQLGVADQNLLFSAFKGDFLDGLGLTNATIQNVNTPVGLTCSPITALGVGSGSSCNAQTVCCDHNSFSTSLVYCYVFCCDADFGLA